MCLPFEHDRSCCCYALYRIIEPNGIEIANANSFFCKIFNISLPHVEGHLLEEVMSCDQYTRIRENVLNCLKQKRYMKFVQKYFYNNAITYWETILTPIFHETGCYVFSNCSILYDFVDNYKEQYFANLFMNTILNGSSDAILIFDIVQTNTVPQFLLRNFNNVFAEYSGYELEDCVNQPVNEIFAEFEIESVKSLVKECLQLKKSFSSEIRLDFKGRELYWNVNVIPLFVDGSSTLLFFMNNITEAIMERREKDEVLYEYDCLFQSSVFGMALVEIPEGWPHEPLKGLRFNDAFDKFYQLYLKNKGEGSTRELISRIQLEKKPIMDQLRIDLENNNYLFYNISAIPIIKGNQVNHIFVTCADSTEQLKLTERMQTNLTKREDQIVQLVAQGSPNKYIAYKLGITEGTVKKIVSNAYKKLNITSRTELVKFYLSDKNLKQKE